MYALFETEFGVHMVRCAEEKNSCHRYGGGSMDVKQGEPLLSVERIAYTHNDIPPDGIAPGPVPNRHPL
jgi:GntR family transcriptional regulator